MSFIDVDDLAALLPDLIADALRTKDTRPAPPSDAITKTSGVVESIDGFTALVQLDDDRPGHITPVQMAAQVAVGDRPVILVSPNGGMVIVGNGGLAGIPPGGGTGTSGLIAEFSASGVVIPTTTSKLWTMSAAGTIGSVVLTMGTKPLPGRQCVVDVRINNVTIWSTPTHRPHFLSTSTNPLITAPDSGTFAANDLISAFVLDGGSGRDLEILVYTATLNSSPSTSGAIVGAFIVGDGTLVS